MFKNIKMEYLIVAIQGFLSGLPFTAVTTTLQIRFIADNASIMIIGCLSLISQVYLYKFLIAPIFDSYKPPFVFMRLGKYKGWIFLNQLCLIISFVAMAFISGKTHPIALIIVASFAALFSAIQDVNIDCYRLQILGEKKLITGSSVYLTAFRIGMLISGGLAIFLEPYLSWKTLYLAFGLIFIPGLSICFINIQQVSVKQVKLHPFRLIVKAYKDLKNQPYILLILMFVFCYGLGDALTLSVNNIFLLKYLNLSMQELALYANFLNLAMLLISAIIAKICFKKYNIFYAVICFGLMQSLTIMMYLILSFYNIKILIIIAILLEGLTGGLVASSIIFVISSIVREPYIATQYALFSAIAAAGTVFLGPIAALIVKHFSWYALYSFALVLSIPGLIAIFSLKEFFIKVESTK